MSETITDKKIVAFCPTGHKLLANQDLSGRLVRCPRCNVQFTLPRQENPRITDSAVMQILGDAAPLPPPPALRPTIATRPCPKCGQQIQESHSVCRLCNCYVGALPGFFRTLSQ